MNHKGYIDTPALRELSAAGAVQRIFIKGVPGGFTLVAQTGMAERTLKTQRGGARLFKSLDSIVPYMQSLGLARFEVDIEHFSTGGLFR